MLRKTLYASLAVCLITAAALAADANWPNFRGPDHDNKSPDTGLLKQWPDGGPKELWQLSGIGHGYSSLTVVDGVCYTTGDKAGKLYLYAINDEGKIKWEVPIGRAWTDGPRDWQGARSTPSYDKGKLYVITAHGELGCYNAANGKKLWAHDLPREWDAKVPKWGYAESPLIHKDLCIVTPGGRRAAIVAYDKATGKPVWKSPPFGGVQYNSSIVATVGKVDMVVGATHNGLIAVDAANGKLLWTNDFAKGNVANCPTPAFSDGYVFWAVGYNKGAVCVKVEPDGNSVKATEVYRTKDMVNHHGGYVIDDGYVYGNHQGGYVCLKLDTGATQWQIKGPGKGSITWADGMLIMVGESGGRVMLGPATPQKPEPAGQFRTAGEGKSWAYPVVIGGKLYVRYNDILTCYDVKAE